MFILAIQDIALIVGTVLASLMLFWLVYSVRRDFQRATDLFIKLMDDVDDNIDSACFDVSRAASTIALKVEDKPVPPDDMAQAIHIKRPN